MYEKGLGFAVLAEFKENEWEATCAQMISAGFRQVPSYNPYWDLQGKTLEDIDGYRVVLQNAAWTK